jgi:hypothetical protein
MSPHPYPYPQHSCGTLPDLDLNLSMNKKKLKNVDVEDQAKVGYQTSSNHLQDDEIYGTVIKMFYTKVSE